MTITGNNRNISFSGESQVLPIYDLRFDDFHFTVFGTQQASQQTMTRKTCSSELPGPTMNVLSLVLCAHMH